jgi:hypothetical protein
VQEFAVEGQETEFLEKPFATEELCETMARLLNLAPTSEDESALMDEDVTDPSPPLASAFEKEPFRSGEVPETSSYSFIDAETEDPAAKTVIASRSESPSDSVDLNHFDLEHNVEEDEEGELRLPEGDGQGELPTTEFYLTEELEEVSAPEGLAKNPDQLLSDMGDEAFWEDDGEMAAEESTTDGFVDSKDLQKTLFDPSVLEEPDQDEWESDFVADEIVESPPPSDTPPEKEENSLNDLFVSSEEIDKMEESDQALDSAIFDNLALLSEERLRQAVTAPLKIVDEEGSREENERCETGFRIVEAEDFKPLNAIPVASDSLMQEPKAASSHFQYQYFDVEKALNPTIEPVFPSVNIENEPLSTAPAPNFVDRNMVHGLNKPEVNITPPRGEAIAMEPKPEGALIPQIQESSLSSLVDKTKIERIISRSVENMVAEYIAQKAPKIIEEIVQKRINRILSDLLGEKEV